MSNWSCSVGIAAAFLETLENGLIGKTVHPGLGLALMQLSFSLMMWQREQEKLKMVYHVALQFHQKFNSLAKAYSNF